MAYCSSKKQKQKKIRTEHKMTLDTSSQGKKKKIETYGANETSPTPFTTQSFNGLVVISDRPFTPLAFRKPQSDVTGFAIGVSFVHCETFKVSIPAQSELSYNNNFFKNERQGKKTQSANLSNLWEGHQKGKGTDLHIQRRKSAVCDTPSFQATDRRDW